MEASLSLVRLLLIVQPPPAERLFAVADRRPSLGADPDRTFALHQPFPSATRRLWPESSSIRARDPPTDVQLGESCESRESNPALCHRPESGPGLLTQSSINSIGDRLWDVIREAVRSANCGELLPILNAIRRSQVTGLVTDRGSVFKTTAIDHSAIPPHSKCGANRPYFQAARRRRRRVSPEV